MKNITVKWTKYFNSEEDSSKEDKFGTGIYFMEYSDSNDWYWSKENGHTKALPVYYKDTASKFKLEWKI